MIVILYIMDSLRPDFLSCYGHPNQTSPHIDRLAEEGVIFTHAFAQATWTRPSGASILSSTYPSVHDVNGLYDALPSYVPVVPEYLKRYGFRTIAISSMGNISPYFGFGRGFDVFVELYKDKNIAERRRKVLLKNQQWEPHFQGDEGGDRVPIATSEDINEFTLSMLKTGGAGDVFIFIWSLDTHGPYFHRDMGLAHFFPDDVIWVTEDVARAKSDGDIDRLMRLYEDMIYYNDHHLGALIEKLKGLGLYEEALLIVTGDHGEAFGEHDFNSHGKEPYDELIRVPLIMKFPFSQFYGRVSSVVQHIDIVPTLLDFLKIPAGDHRSMQGKSLLPLLQDRMPVNEYAFAEHWPGKQYLSHIALRTEDYKLMAVRRQEVTLRQWLRDRRKLWPSPWFVHKPMCLYDLRKDPGEKVNIIHEEKDKTRHFHSRVRTILRGNATLARTFKKKKGVDEGPNTEKVERVDDEVSKQLKALGYFD